MQPASRRVAFVVSDLNAGGAERAALNLAAAAPRSRCVIVAERGSGDLAGDSLARGAVVVSNDPRKPGRATRFRRLARVLRRLRPDVVVAMLSPAVSTVGARACGAPVVHWLQAPWSRTTRVGDPGLVGRAHRLALRTIVSRSAVVACTSPGLADDCATLGLGRTRLALLPNGLFLPPPPEPRAVAGGPLRIVTVGRLARPKRHDLLLEAAAELARERPIELVLVGGGPDLDDLRRHAEALGIGGLVTFTGFVEDPYRELARADVFALATDYEGFGNVIVEALACGLPAVVSDVPYGPRFILGDAEFGVLVPPGAAPALAEGLRKAAGLVGRAEGRDAARRRAEDFAVERVAERFEELVDGVLRDVPTRWSLSAWP